MAVHLFILLPAARSNGGDNTDNNHPYFDIDENLSERLSVSISELSIFEKYVAAENDLKTYYDKTVVEELSKIVNEFRSEFPQVETELLMNLLVYPSNLNSVEWQDERISDESTNAVYVRHCTLKDDILSEAGYRVRKGHRPEPLLVNMSAMEETPLYCQMPDEAPGSFFIIKSSPMKAAELIVNMKEVREPRREYCHNKKHDKPNDFVSGLISSKQKAEQMVHVGIGMEQWLIWAYDDDTETYMAYRCDDKNSDGKRWHAYTPLPENDKRRRNLKPDFLSFMKKVAQIYKSRQS